MDDDALLEALDKGVIAVASLDVFKTEPLSKDHAYWTHPNVLTTPHVAAKTRANTASRVIAGKIQRSESGLSLRYVVDRGAGY